MLDRRTSRRRSAGLNGRRSESLDAEKLGDWFVITDPYQLLLRRFTDKQFDIVLAHLPDMPAHLGVEGRFLAAARHAYPELTVLYLVPGPCRRRPSSATEWWSWNNLPCAERQFLATLDVIRRIYRVDEVCFPERKAA